MNKQQKLEIASLINTLQVAENMKMEGASTGDWDMFYRFRNREIEATIDLYEVHGIRLACLRDFLEERED